MRLRFGLLQTIKLCFYCKLVSSFQALRTVFVPAQHLLHIYVRVKLSPILDTVCSGDKNRLLGTCEHALCLASEVKRLSWQESCNARKIAFACYCRCGYYAGAVTYTCYSDPSLYRASPIAASLLRGIFYSES